MKDALPIAIVCAVAAVLITGIYFIYVGSDRSGQRYEQLQRACIEHGGNWIDQQCLYLRDEAP